MIKLDLKCGKCGESLEREIYRARQWGTNFVFYCKECMKNVKSVKSEDLKRFEANEVEALRDKMIVEVKEGFQTCRTCQKKATVKVTNSSAGRDVTDYYCEKHAQIEECEDVDENHEGFRLRSMVYLLSYDGSVTEKSDKRWVIRTLNLRGLALNPEKLAVPEVKDKKNGPAILLKRVLDQAVQEFKKAFHPDDVTLTNAFHFRALLSARYQLEILINNPPKGGVLKDGNGSGSGFSMAGFDVTPKFFKIGEECHVTINVCQDPKDCKEYFSTPGFFVHVLGVKRENETLKVTFKLEMDELTKTSAMFGVCKTTIRIGFINMETEDAHSKPVTVTTDP